MLFKSGLVGVVFILAAAQWFHSGWLFLCGIVALGLLLRAHEER